MMAFQGNECVWILLLAFTTINLQDYATDGREDFIPKQPNVTISNYGFLSINISWDAEEIAEKGHLSVCYNLTYQFLDRRPTWIISKKNYRTFKLNMQSRLFGSVSTALCKGNQVHIQSKPAEFVYNTPQVYINNVSCVLFNITNLNCSWNFRTDAPEDINYSFAVRLKSKWLICKHYLNQHKKNVGCYMHDVVSDNKDNIRILNRIRIGFFSESHNFSKTFSPEVVEILNPPRKILVLSENGNTIIKWLPPESITNDDFEEGLTSSYDPTEEENNFMYEIRVIENKSKMIFRQTNVIEKEQIFTDLAKSKQYYIQIRARHRHEVSKFWGEWSEPVYINKDYTVFPKWILIVIVPALFATLSFYLCKRYIKKLLVSPVPHPSQNIKNWLYMDWSNDNRSQATIAVQNEQTVPLNEIEIVPTTRDCVEKP
ncbi:interleukin-5 receptor subunit alpha-like isoform X2 [Hyla sarda]|uniref:interleukin-5 receptor subunit alpha-like isoform X2 n=1 Tax=Hyla sarda TaxID=327740 RepID=UPI0024C2DCEB|nr:interleukin-5 receptor subunit alpha-like isoform X2 [Hyla sarda]